MVAAMYALRQNSVHQIRVIVAVSLCKIIWKRPHLVRTLNIPAKDRRIPETINLKAELMTQRANEKC